MQTKRLTASAILAASFWVGNAYAADVMAPEPAYVAPPTIEDVWKWTGFHLGIDAGGQFDFVHSSVYANNQHSLYETWQNASDEADLGAHNFFFSGDVGADYQTNNFVFGVFANYDWSPSSSSASHQLNTSADCIGCSGGVNDVEAQQTREKDVGNTVTYGDAWGVGLRAGALLNPKALLYVLGGYGQKQISSQSNYYFDYYNNLAYSSGLSAGGWQPGWFVGAGVETAVGKHLSLGLEYRFAQYNGFSTSCDLGNCAQSYQDGNGPPYGIGGPYEFNESGLTVGKTMSHTIRARLSWWLN